MTIWNCWFIFCCLRLLGGVLSDKICPRFIFVVLFRSLVQFFDPSCCTMQSASRRIGIGLLLVSVGVAITIPHALWVRELSTYCQRSSASTRATISSWVTSTAGSFRFVSSFCPVCSFDSEWRPRNGQKHVPRVLHPSWDLQVVQMMRANVASILLKVAVSLR